MLTCKRCGLTDETVSDIDTGSTCHRELSDCIRRLRAVVDRMPETADGVPVVPGMNVYQCGGKLRRQVILAAENFANLPQEDASLRLFFSRCYSTPEAAEAAEAADAARKATP